MIPHVCAQHDNKSDQIVKSKLSLQLPSFQNPDSNTLIVYSGVQTYQSNDASIDTCTHDCMENHSWH